MARLALLWLGWTFEGNLPDLPKAVIIVAPHTTNWDFVLGMAAMFALDLQVSWLGKQTVFRAPFGGFFRWLGGIAIDRTAHAGVVEQLVATFRAREELILGLAPEGTRRRVERWKTGFYHIAVGARVPIVPVTFDYPRRVIRFDVPLSPTGDLPADLERLHAFFRADLTPLQPPP
jgi:1-acyl-sn-glycerol-3-phosphate acyltransferase